jgi:NAD(P)-dependent dehydrogenase (short-subunit alcohol dehydrogenase family)
VAIRKDIIHPEDIRALVRRSAQEFGRLHIMVNNAGVDHKVPFLQTPLEVWNKVIA